MRLAYTHLDARKIGDVQCYKMQTFAILALALFQGGRGRRRASTSVYHDSFILQGLDMFSGVRQADIQQTSCLRAVTF